MIGIGGKGGLALFKKGLKALKKKKKKGMKGSPPTKPKGGPFGMPLSHGGGFNPLAAAGMGIGLMGAPVLAAAPMALAHQAFK